ncbi:uncharacterized protein LOC144658622 isoform X3 [Oculina patagonica]
MGFKAKVVELFDQKHQFISHLDDEESIRRIKNAALPSGRKGENPDDVKVVKTAPTGKAAFNIKV